MTNITTRVSVACVHVYIVELQCPDDAGVCVCVCARNRVAFDAGFKRLHQRYKDTEIAQKEYNKHVEANEIRKGLIAVRKAIRAA